MVLNQHFQGHVQTNSSKAGLSRAGSVFYVSVIPISVARQVAWSRAVQTLIGITLRSSALLYSCLSGHGLSVHAPFKSAVILCRYFMLQYKLIEKL